MSKSVKGDLIYCYEIVVHETSTQKEGYKRMTDEKDKI